MADWTAITGIVVSGVIGPSVAAAWTARQQGAAARHDTATRDREAGRQLLDDAVLAAREAVGLSSSIPSLLLTWGSKIGTDAKSGATRIVELQAAGRDADVLYARIAVFFGPNSEISESFKLAVQSVERVVGAVRSLHGLGAAPLATAAKELDGALAEATDAERRLLLAAHRYAGVEAAKATVA